MGLPQGSVLSPFLFNELLRPIMQKLGQEAEVLSYADDLQLLFRGYDIQTLEQQARRTLRLLTSLCAGIGLHINASKCECILFSRKTTEHSMTWNIWDDTERSVEIKTWEELAALQWRRGVPIVQHLGVDHALLQVSDQEITGPSDLRALPKQALYTVILSRLVATTTSMVVLGITLDPQLSLSDHTTALVRKCKQKVQLVRRLHGATWGPSLEVRKRTGAAA
eukprot:1214194-Amphidinium_carterae.1